MGAISSIIADRAVRTKQEHLRSSSDARAAIRRSDGCAPLESEETLCVFLKSKGASIGLPAALKLWRAACASEHLDLIGDACKTGHLSAAQRLVNHFGHTAADGSWNGDWLAAACGHGHLEIARWLAVRFELTAENGRECATYALSSACENDHLTTAQWLADHFNLTADDVRAGSALCSACECGSLDTAMWLVYRFNLATDEARRAYERTLIYAEWTMDGACADYTYAEPVLQWLEEDFEFVRPA